jgi:hypothetical protein
MSQELGLTKSKLTEDVSRLQSEYLDLEVRGQEKQESLLFEIGRLEQQLQDRNRDYGGVLEKFALTQKALEVAEEKIGYLEAIDKARDEHFKELQHDCASHEKCLSEVCKNSDQVE